MSMARVSFPCASHGGASHAGGAIGPVANTLSGNGRMEIRSSEHASLIVGGGNAVGKGGDKTAMVACWHQTPRRGFHASRHIVARPFSATRCATSSATRRMSLRSSATGASFGSSARSMSFGSSSLLRGDSSSDALTYHRPPRGGVRKEPRQRRVVECKVKRRKEPRLDAVIERNKKFRIVQRIQELLGKQEGGRMSLKELGKHRNKIGLSGGRRCVALIRRFPSIFQVYDKGAGNIWFELTPEAARRDARERELRAIMEPILVDKLCKLLMMSATQSLSVESVGHVRRELGLPEDFKT
ncbi:unnamed protein product, partial [Closterium sp. NIES-54]